MIWSSLRNARSTPWGGRQHLVNLLGGHAVSHQGDFQGELGALAQGAFAGECVQVPEVRPAFGRGCQRLGVVGQGGRPDEYAHAALADRVVDQVFGIQLLQRWQGFEKALFAASLQVGVVHLDQVPADGAGCDHGLDPAQFAVVVVRAHRGAMGLLKGRVERCLLGLLVQATQRDDGQSGGVGFERRDGNEESDC